jgi:hypothetical protein
MDATNVKSVEEKFQLRDFYRTTLWNKRKKGNSLEPPVRRIKEKKRTNKRDINSDASSGEAGGSSSKAITLRNQLYSTSCCLFKPKQSLFIALCRMREIIRETPG